MLTIVDGTFSWALECIRIKLLKGVRRKAWSEGIYIKLLFLDPKDKIPSYIYLVYPDGRTALYNPTQRDLLGTDWEEHYDNETN